MFQLLFVLFLLALVFAVVAVVGHGIWMGCAFLFSELASKPPEKRKSHRARDVFSAETLATPLSDLRAAMRFVEWLRCRGDLSDRLYENLSTAMKKQEARLVGGGAAVSPIAKTSPAPHAPVSRAVPPVVAPAVPPVAQLAQPPATTRPPRGKVLPPDASRSADAAKAADIIEAQVAPERAPAESPVRAAPTGQPTDAAAPVIFEPVTPDRRPTESQRPEPQAPQRPLSQLLQAFMEERNIRWGEILAGILIVGSAIGLVVSMWSWLSNSFRFFPALVFLTATAGVFGAGLYTLRKWKLESTSRGLLTISLLLVPLNFLAAIAISPGPPTIDALYVFAVAAGIAAYGAITYGAARVLLPHAVWPCVLAVMGTSAGQLIVGRDWLPDASATMLLVLPLACFLVGTLAHLARIGRRGQLSLRLTVETFLLLGVAAFALLMPLARAAVKSGDLVAILAELAPALTPIAAVVVGYGVVVQQRVRRVDWVRLRVAGTWLALFGGVLMLLIVACAWPDPTRLIAVSLLVFASLVALAHLNRLPMLLAPAVVSLALAVFLTFHLFMNHLPHVSAAPAASLINAFFLGHTSVLLTAVAAVACGAAGLLKRSGRSDHRIGVLWGIVPVGAAALLSAIVAGFRATSDGGAWASAVLAAGALALPLLGGRFRQGWITSLGSTLLLLALVQICTFNQALVVLLRGFVSPFVLIVVSPFLLHATVCCLLAAATRLTVIRRWLRAETADDLRRPLFAPLTIWAVVTSSLAALPTILGWFGPNGWHAACAFWIAAVWLAISLLRRWQTLFWLFQAMATAGICLAVSAWFSTAPYSARLFALPQLTIQLAALAAWSAIWCFIRRDCRRWPWLHNLMTPRVPSVDRLCLYAAVGGVLVIATAGCLPGVDAELRASIGNAGIWTGQAGMESRAIDVLDMSAGGSWTLILAVLLLWSVGALVAWSVGAFRKSPRAVLMLGAAVFGAVAVWLLARTGISTWQLDDYEMRVVASATMWRLLLVVALAAGVSFLNRVSTIDLAAIVCLAFALPLLIAPWFATFTASALCWGLALTGLAIAGVIWARRPLARLLIRRFRLSAQRLRTIPVHSLGAFALHLTVLPVILISLDRLLPVFAGRPTVFDPAAGQFHLLALYAGPIALLAVTLIGYAVRERSSYFALAGSMLINAAVTLLSVFLVWLPDRSASVLVVIRLVQWNALALGGVGLVWLATRRWVEPRPPSPRSERLPSSGVPLGIQVSCLVLAAAMLTAWAVLIVVVSPAHLSEAVRWLADPFGWAVLIVAMLVGGWYLRSWIAEQIVAATSCAALSVVGMAAAASHAANGPHNWLAFHVLSGGWLLCAATTTVLSCVATYLASKSGAGRHDATEPSAKPLAMIADNRWLLRAADSLAVCSTAAGTAVVLLAIRGNWLCRSAFDPWQPWWAAGLTAGTAVLAAALALRGRSQAYAYGSVFLAGLATVFLSAGISHAFPVAAFVSLSLAVVTTVAGVSLFWAAVELWWQRARMSAFDSNGRQMPVHHLVCLATVTVLSLLLGLFMLARIFAPANAASGSVAAAYRVLCSPTGWLAVSVVGLLIGASLWDRTARHTLPALYAWGLVVAGAVIEWFNPSAEDAVFGIGLAAGCYALLTSQMWAGRHWLSATGRRWGVPQTESTDDRVAAWLPACNVALGLLVALISVGGSLLFETLWMRLCLTGATALAAAGIATTADTRARQILQHVALTLGACAAVALGWSVMAFEPTSQWLPSNFWLPRAIRLVVMLATTAFVYGAVLPRFVASQTDWQLALRRIAVACGATGIAVLLGVLGLEMLVFDPTAVAPWTQVLIVAAALVGLIVALISLALQRGRDPLALSDRGRQGYVYAAEIVAAWLVLHIYLTVPVIFGGIFLQYWPFIVMGIAFLAVGAGEAFRRCESHVLSEPFTRTGVFLPLLPALGFWVGRPDPTMSGFTALLFVMGLLYVLVSIWRRSFACAAIAALAGNSSLWSLLTDHEWSVFEHPQLFILPPALCVLVAVHLNRNFLDEAQRTAARYVSLLVIYVASTGEMFLQMHQALWPPMVLAGLSIAGVLAGMLLRVRAFVYLGASFLLLSVLSMVWHAARYAHHPWPWWTFGIVMGILILTMFGIFEKKRLEVREMFERLRAWER